MNTIQQYPRVFISHSHQDKPFVERLVKDLLDANLNVWVDKQELAPGDSVIEKVSHGLRSSD
ncbi:toll/interleukin-1 receptor domain-containing protein [Halomonas sp. QX-2]|uniref:Toll/interleukin-1 receptor domain-containing protein n=1 Tax=Vreelandella sedimenti TaxID=2729618 RepID=A0A7Z0SPP7_9GAMM|nr:toll/interleukin-1 receptor domain-containing protein [Halomonas sedimenti]